MTKNNLTIGSTPNLLRHFIISSIQFGTGAALLPVLATVIGELALDPTKVKTSIQDNIGFDLLIMLVIFLGGAFVGSIRFVARVSRFSRVGPMSCDRKQMAQLIDTWHNPEFKTILYHDRASLSDHAPCGPIQMFFEALGVIKASGGRAVAVSQSADAFLCSLSAHLVDSNATFIGDWNAGSHEREAARLTDTIRATEEYRISSSPQGNPTPARQVRAAIALIRADFGGTAKFLAIKSYTWNKDGAWTPVMGGEEPQDNEKLSNTIKREIQEEMKVHSEDIVYIQELAVAHDKRISKRLGIYSEYTYAIFAAQLAQSSARVRHFFASNPTVAIDYSKAVRTHEFTWLPWDNLLTSEHLQTNMPTVVDAISKLTPDVVPQTISMALP
jgi:ADP-ribose pyrophosphatase YjhB (NUDIX family)